MKNFRTFFILGLEQPYLTLGDKKILQFLRPAGVVLYSRNFDYTKRWFKWFSRLLEEVKTSIESEKAFVAIDHEGGRVFRLFEPFTKFPDPWDYKLFANEVGSQMGQELRQIGINLNFAPCVDVLFDKRSKVIGKRAFSDDPYEVLEAGRKFLLGLQQEGVFGCFKHFPGHGSTAEDSHISLPTVTKSIDQLLKEDLVPYVSIDECLFIMTAHIVYPKISNEIATFSKFFLQTILRDRLNFRGKVISDDLEMSAVRDLIVNGDVPLKNLKSFGIDFAIVSQNSRCLEEELIKVTCENRFAVSIEEDILPRFRTSSKLDLSVFSKGAALLKKIEESL